MMESLVWAGVAVVLALVAMSLALVSVVKSLRARDEG